MVDSEMKKGHLALLREVHSLAQRIRAVESSAAPERARLETLEIGPITIKQVNRTVFVRGEKVAFPKLQYNLLLALVSPTGQLRTRKELLDSVWRDHRLANEKTLDVHIRRLRQKIELNIRKPQFIITVRGVGFYFDAEGTQIT